MGFWGLPAARCPLFSQFSLYDFILWFQGVLRA